MLLDHLFDTPLLQVLGLVLFKMQDHFGAAANGLTCSPSQEPMSAAEKPNWGNQRTAFHTRHSQLTMVSAHSEGAPSGRFPGILLIIIVFCDHNHLLSYQVGRVKTNSKLPNHGDVCTSLPEETQTSKF